METNENKIATRKCKEVAAQSFTILIALRFTHAGAWYYLLNIPPDVRIKYTFFFNRNNIKKVHDRLYYLENGGRSVCGTAAIGGQQRPASPEKRKFSYSPNTLDYFPFNTLYTLATSDDHDFPRKIVLSLDRATTGDPEERESRALSSRRKNRVYTAASGSPKRLVFSSDEFTFTFTTGANFGPSLGSKRSLYRIAESRDARPTESTLKTHRMSRRSLNKINMAAINV